MAEVLRSPLEGRVVLRNVGWETYQRLLREDPDRSAPRFFYDRGVLEILSPSFEHETVSDIIGSLVKELAVELEMDVVGAGSTTFDREDLARGFEPDASFYFAANARKVRGARRIHLDAGDPTPDLVVEVDITSPSTSKLPIYARLGVAEVWRHDGERLAILGLRQGERDHYVEVAESMAFAPVRVPGAMVTRLIEDGLTLERPAWVRAVRAKARKLR